MKQPERTPSESERWIALLSRAGPFSLLSRVELEDLADGFTWFSAPGGQTLFSEGDFSDEIFIVVTGSLAAYVRLPDGGERFVGRIESGHPVGEMGVIVIHETFLHVDGGVVNNLPVDTMRQIGAGPVIAVDIGAYARITADTPTEWPLASRGWFRRRGTRRGPSIFQLLWRVATVSGDARVEGLRSQSDVLLRPSLQSVDLLNWRAFDEATMSGYQHTIERIDEIKSKISRQPSTSDAIV